MRSVQRLLAATLVASVSTANVPAQAAARGAVPVRPPAYGAQRPSPPRHARQARPVVFHHKSVELAWQTAAAKKRPLVVMFTSDSCRYCTKMLQETYGHPTIQRMLATHTETVIAHADANKALIERLKVRAYPTSLIVTPEGKIVASIEGFVDPQTFVERVAPLLKPAQTTAAASDRRARQVAAANTAAER